MFRYPEGGYNHWQRGGIAACPTNARRAYRRDPAGFLNCPAQPAGRAARRGALRLASAGAARHRGGPPGGRRGGHRHAHRRAASRPERAGFLHRSAGADRHPRVRHPGVCALPGADTLQVQGEAAARHFKKGQGGETGDGGTEAAASGTARRSGGADDRCCR
eukprot:ctg_2412.g453